MSRVQDESIRDKPRDRYWTTLACLLPVVVIVWVAEPRLATNRPSYGLRETVLLVTAPLAVPCVYAIVRLTRRPSGSPSAHIRRWLGSAAMSFAALPVVLTVSGTLVAVPGDYGDGNTPGFTAGVYSAVAAIAITLVTLVWAALARLLGERPHVDI